MTLGGIENFNKIRMQKVSIYQFYYVKWIKDALTMYVIFVRINDSNDFSCSVGRTNRIRFFFISIKLSRDQFSSKRSIQSDNRSVKTVITLVRFQFKKSIKMHDSNGSPRLLSPSIQQTHPKKEKQTQRVSKLDV